VLIARGQPQAALAEVAQEPLEYLRQDGYAVTPTEPSNSSTRRSSLATAMCLASRATIISVNCTMIPAIG
jgi:hypothetical protein